MQLNMVVLVQILELIEENCNGSDLLTPLLVDLDGNEIDPQVVHYHSGLILRDGLAVGLQGENNKTIANTVFLSLTLEGHKLLEQLRQGDE